MNVQALETLYYKNDPEGHFFDRDTLAFFGSRYRRVVTTKNGYVYTEKQTHAPIGIPQWTATLFDQFGNESIGSARGNTRKGAVANLEAALESIRGN